MTPQEQRAYEAGYTAGFMDASVKLHEQRSVSDVEPVAWVCEGSVSDEKHAVDYQQEDIDAIPIGTMLYTTPPTQCKHCLQRSKDEL